MGFDQQLVDTYLGRALKEFQTNPLAVNLMRRLALERSDLFINSGLKYLQSSAAGSGDRMLTHLLLRQESLFERISNPEMSSKKAAVELFRRFQSIDPSFDVRLARKLPGRSVWNQGVGFDAEHSARSLDILDETSQGRRLLPILGHLTDAHDPRISARATLFVGRRIQSADWASRQLARSDQRIRANAVESLWGLKTRPAMSLFDECLKDDSNRVAGNALVGLHIGGREQAVNEIIRMSRDEHPERRIASAWAMGRIAGAEFAARLMEMVRDEDTRVRGMALRALVLIHKTAPVPEEAKVEMPQIMELAAPEIEETPLEPDLMVAMNLRLDGTATVLR